MSPARACPDCQQPMNALFVVPPGRADVRLERCGRCAGLWFEHGELDAVVGHALSVDLVDPEGTTRRCPVCTASMAAGVVSGVAVETCTSCLGVFFDFHDVADLGNEALAKAAKPPPEPPRAPGGEGESAVVSASSFECAKCGQRNPFSEANGTAAGLVCRACTPQVQRAPKGLDGALDKLEDGGDGLELLEGLFALFARLR